VYCRDVPVFSKITLVKSGIGTLKPLPPKITHPKILKFTEKVRAYCSLDDDSRVFYFAGVSAASLECPIARVVAFCHLLCQDSYWLCVKYKR
jgi:hypothetical protein